MEPPKRGWIGLRGPALPKLEDQPWGSIGPHALTNYAKQYGVDRMASPTDRFFPLHWDHVGLLFDPALSLEALTTQRTDLIHLYHSHHEPLFRAKIPRSSPLWEIIDKATGPSSTRA